MNSTQTQTTRSNEHRHPAHLRATRLDQVDTYLSAQDFDELCRDLEDQEAGRLYVVYGEGATC